MTDKFRHGVTQDVVPAHVGDDATFLAQVGLVGPPIVPSSDVHGSIAFDPLPVPTAITDVN